jgi:hypothetical protein
VREIYKSGDHDDHADDARNDKAAWDRQRADYDDDQPDDGWDQDPDAENYADLGDTAIEADLDLPTRAESRAAGHTVTDESALDQPPAWTLTPRATEATGLPQGDSGKAVNTV